MDEFNNNRDDQNDDLLIQKVGRAAQCTRVVGHLGGRRVDHQHRDHRQYGDNHPQHLITSQPAEQTSLRLVVLLSHLFSSARRPTP